MGPDTGDHRIQSEMAHHLAELERQLIAQGMSLEEARREARARFGDPARFHRAAKAVGPTGWRARFIGLPRGVAGDLVQVTRGLRRVPTFTLTVVVTLALALGAMLPVFGVAWDVLWRPLEVRQPESLVMLVERMPEGGIEASPTSMGTFQDWKRGLGSVQDAAAWEWVSRTLEDPANPKELVALQVTGNLLPMMGIVPELGRILTPADEVVGGPSRTVMIAHALWMSHFGGDPGIVGRDIQVDGRLREVVGVLPARLDFLPLGVAPMLFDPSPHVPQFPTNRGARILHVAGRLARGKSVADASAEVAAMTEEIASTYPASARGWSAEARSLTEHLRGNARPRVIALSVGVVLLLLVACVNVANLLLVRTADGMREMAVRAALGAGRGRLARLRLVEGLVLGLLGGGVGLLLAAGLQGWLASAPGTTLPSDAGTSLPPATILLGLALATVVGLAVGLVPALRGAGKALGSLARGPAGARGGMSLHGRHALLVVQLGVTTVLLVGAGLLVRTVVALRAVDLGFDTAQVVAARVSLDPVRYPQGTGDRTYYDQLLERVRAIPGVQAAGLTSALPMDPIAANFDLPTRIDEATTWDAAPQADFRIVGTGLMESLRFRLLAGRFFRDDDRGGPLVAIVNRSLAAVYWPGDSPIGKRIQPVWLQQRGFAEVVGVVEDTRFYGPAEASRMELFVPLSQVSWGFSTLAVRTGSDEEVGPLMTSLERIMVELDPLMPPMAVFPVASLVEATMATERFYSALLAGFAVLALALSAAGVYGLLAYSVRLRAREMGVRLALGATPQRVTRMVLGTGVALAGVGVLLGLGAALPTTRLVRGMLFGVSPLDPLTMVGVSALLLLVATAACLNPALRAAHLDPVRTLREE